MFILAATTSTLEVLLSAAVTSNQLPWVASYADLTTTTFAAGSLTGATNSTTAVTLVSAPAASTQRQVKSLNVFNADTVSATVTIRYNENGTTRIIVKATLAIGESLVYTQDAGWQVLTTNGSIKQSSTTNLTTKGDLLVYDTGTARLPVGTDGQVLIADSASTPGVKWFTYQDSDSIQLSGTSRLEVRKLRDVAGDPGSPVNGEVWYNTTTTNPRVRGSAGSSNIVRELFTLTTETAAVGSGSTAEATLDSNAQFTFPANSLAVGQVYRVRLQCKIIQVSGTVTFRTYFGASAGTGGHFDIPAFTPGNATTYFVIEFLIRVTAAGATAQVLVSGWRLQATGILAVNSANLSATFDATAPVVLSYTAQWSASAANSLLVEGYTLERLH
jgi:hypothetical protein